MNLVSYLTALARDPVLDPALDPAPDPCQRHSIPSRAGEWRKTELEKLKAFEAAFGDANKKGAGEDRRSPQWEDTHDDGSSDGIFEEKSFPDEWSYGFNRREAP
jgi:hypothetical protein